MLPSFDYIRPDNLKAAVKQLSSEGAAVHGGGTDLLGCLRDRIFDVSKLVSISRIPDLKGIRETADGGLRIGALATITDIAENPVIQERFSVLAQAAAEVASPQLRNQGTIGGNICQKPRCWYYRGDFDCLRKGGDRCFAPMGENQFHCILGSDSICFIVHPSDPAPALVALNAKAEIQGPKGKRSLALEEFHMPPGVDVTRETYLNPGEIVTEIVIPPAPQGLRSAYRKVRTRRAWDFAIAGTAIALQFDGDTVTNGRVVLSGAAPVPWRSQPVEKRIIGKKLDEELIAEAAEASMEGAMPLKKNDYKIALFKAVVFEELTKIAGNP